jgi:hypothetical protein
MIPRRHSVSTSALHRLMTPRRRVLLLRRVGVRGAITNSGTGLAILADGTPASCVWGPSVIVRCPLA